MITLKTVLENMSNFKLWQAWISKTNLPTLATITTTKANENHCSVH